MTFTLADATYRVARELDVTKEGWATGGAAGPPLTLIDTNDRIEPNDYWNGGTCWILRDAAGAGADPEGSFGVVADTDLATNTITMGVAPRPIISATISSGDHYALGKRRYPLQRLITAVNAGLNDLGEIPVSDIATITTADNQTEYDLPRAASTDLREVYIQNNLDDTDDYQWTLVHNWEVHKTASGTADKLITPVQYASGYLIKLVYIAPHATLVAATDEIDDIVHIDRVVYPATLWALNWYRGKTMSNRRAILDKIDQYEKKAGEAEIRYPIEYPSRTGKVMLVGPPAYSTVGEPDKVSLL